MTEEEIRYECLKLAIECEPRASAEGLISKANKFENFIKYGAKNND